MKNEQREGAQLEVDVMSGGEDGPVQNFENFEGSIAMIGTTLKWSQSQAQESEHDQQPAEDEPRLLPDFSGY